jgi:hypothetical protein
MATAHLLNGYLGVGKTTLARRLEHELPAVRFTHDEWMISTAMIQRSNARNSRTCGAASMRSWSRSGYVACSWGSMSCSTSAFGRVRSATSCVPRLRRSAPWRASILIYSRLDTLFPLCTMHAHRLPLLIID